jgi:hypothetical protein
MVMVCKFNGDQQGIGKPTWYTKWELVATHVVIKESMHSYEMQ